MVNISDLPRVHGRAFEIEARVLRPKWQTSVNGTDYVRCTLADNTGTVQGYLWHPSERVTAGMSHGHVVKAAVTGKQLDRQYHLVIDRLSPPTSPDASISTLPACECPVPGGLHVLREQIAAIDEPVLRTFLYSLFALPGIALPYLRVPASHRHHHAFPGGLLAHSLEVAEIARCQKYLTDGHDRSLLIAAALVHDLGKIRTHDTAVRASSLVHHDNLALELMAEPLQALQQAWPDGAAALRYLLTWKQSPRRGAYPRMIIASILEMADRVSAGRDVERKAYSDKQSGSGFATWTGSGPANRFWRPSKPLRWDLSLPEAQS